VAGVSLYISMATPKGGTRRNAPTPILETLFILVIRFVIWPVASIGVIYALAAKTDLLGNDPMLWFTLMLMPTGPPAMKLITMIQVSDASVEDEYKVAKLLTISYMISPILALTVVGALRASQAGIGT
jgi:auxin efflux carrier family protein